jgi:hypothetical protein
LLTVFGDNGGEGGRVPEKTGRKQAGREQRGRFRPGQSGNPKGRPRGSRNKLTEACLDLLGDESEAIMSAAIKRAKRGDGVALRLCIERLVPARAARDRAVELELPAVAQAADLVAAAAAVIERAAAGDISLSEAREFMQLLETQRKVIETAELAVRLEVLERAAEPRGPLGFAPGEVDPGVAARVRRLEE